MTQILAVVDLQFGSTGKGQIAGTLAHHWEPDTVCTAWGPNAGHTFRKENKTWVHRMLATSALAPSVRNILIGPGSVVDVPRLAEEIKAAREELRGKALIIHPQAAILNMQHAEDEKILLKIGSTMKGTAEAAIAKMRRNTIGGPTAGTNTTYVYDELHDALFSAELSIVISSTHYDDMLDCAEKVILEGAQGFSLGIHTDFYPYATSRDVSTTQLLADCRVPFPRGRDLFKVVGVARTYPIRVANRKDPATGQYYTSGGCYRDQEEITWEQIDREPELTTVTKLPRRVFTFSHDQIRAAARICRPDSIALTFCDYTKTNGESEQLIHDMEAYLPGAARVRYTSWGPTMDDVWYRDVGGTRQAMPDFNAWSDL